MITSHRGKLFPICKGLCPESGLMPWIHREFLRINKKKDNATKKRMGKGSELEFREKKI